MYIRLRNCKWLNEKEERKNTDPMNSSSNVNRKNHELIITTREKKIYVNHKKFSQKSHWIDFDRRPNECYISWMASFRIWSTSYIFLSSHIREKVKSCLWIVSSHCKRRQKYVTLFVCSSVENSGSVTMHIGAIVCTWAINWLPSEKTINYMHLNAWFI